MKILRMIKLPIKNLLVTTDSTISVISKALRSSHVKVLLDLSKSTQLKRLAEVNIKSPIESGKNAFMDCKYLTGIILPETVTYIGSYAFANCESLKTFTVPDSVTDMKGLVFEGCTNLTSIHIGKGINSYSIMPSTFVAANLTSLDTFTVSEENTAFTVVDDVLYTADKKILVAFPCAKENLTIPNSVTKIGEGAVFRAIAIESVDIPNSVTCIGDYAFSECPVLSEVKN
ncbi:MAG: leucine-rich repeat domain-containing protein [Treponema sp.]|nr:leucine-rich repeat domain-containing protein [Treponema sp.]